MMKSGSVSLGDLQGEEFIVDNDHEEVRRLDSSHNPKRHDLLKNSSFN